LYDSSTPNTFYVDELLKRDGTIAHEFGHLLGFDHTSNVENSIMSYAKERVGITDAKGFNVWAKYRNPRG
jgi:predicted Zn-dependent protease